MKSLRLLPAVLALVVPLSAQRARGVIVVPGRVTPVITDTMGTRYPVPFPTWKVYQAVLATYAELKLPIEVHDSVEREVGTEIFHRQRQVGGRQISTYLGCGDGMTGPNADSYRVYMYLMSRVDPDGEGSTVRTAFVAGARNFAEGAGRDAMPCESTGRLEIRIHQMVLKKAAGL
jgi:hypothetical protein